MAEYMDIMRIDDWNDLSILDDNGNARYVYDVGELPRADVVGRKEYEAVCIKCNNLENRIEKQNQNIKRLKAYESIVETENKELRSKIDEAIKEMEELINHSKLPTVNIYNKYSDGLKDCLDILKRNIGE